MFPAELKYTTEHEWVSPRVETEGALRVGITDFAQEALGDIVYVSLPALGETVISGAAVGELESTKSVSDIFAPVSGEIVAVNDALDSTPELVNTDPYGAGWLFEVRPGEGADPSSAVADLMDAEAYAASVGE